MSGEGPIAVRGGVGGTGAELDRLSEAATALLGGAEVLGGLALDASRAAAALPGGGTLVLDPVGGARLEGELALAAVRALDAAAAARTAGAAVASVVDLYLQAETSCAVVWSGFLVGLGDAAAPVRPQVLCAADRAVRWYAGRFPGTSGTSGPSDPSGAGGGAAPAAAVPAVPVSTPLDGLLAPPVGAAGASAPLALPDLAAGPSGLPPGAPAPRDSPAVTAVPGVGAGGPDVADVLVRVPPGAVTAVASVLAAVLVGGPGGVPAAARVLSGSAARQGLLGGTATTTAPSPLLPGTAPTAPPRGVSDLLTRTAAVEATGPGRPAGRFRVERVRRPGAPPAAVLYLPGTQRWALDGPLPTDAASDLQAVAGQRTAAADAAERALADAGVGRDEPLLVVGHSQGGMTAAALASDPAFRERFHPVAVLTAGAPVGARSVPDDVALLAVQHTDDVVLGAAGPAPVDVDLDPRATVVEGPTPDGVRPHDTPGYARTGALVDASTEPSVLAWRAVAAPFLAGGGATSTTTEVVAVRAP